MMIANFPQYPWFEAMTNYPYGTRVHWGPIFSGIGACIAIITGAVTRIDMIRVLSWIPPIMAALLVPFVYKIGCGIKDQTCGIFAAFLIAIIPGMLFQRSFLGYFDHHIAEVLITTIFSFGYMEGISRSETPGNGLKEILTPACIAGLASAIAILIIPTVIIFAVIAGITTLIIWAIVLKEGNERKMRNLVILNVISFFPVICVVLPVVYESALLLNTYSIFIPIIYLSIIIMTVLGWIVILYSKKLKSRNILTFFVSIIIISVTAISIIFPYLRTTLVDHVIQFFFVSDLQSSISEAGPWNLSIALTTYNVGLILFVFGFVLCVWKYWKTGEGRLIYLIIWTALMFIATIQHWRFEYYLSVPMVLLIGCTASYSYNNIITDYNGKNRSIYSSSKSNLDDKKNISLSVVLMLLLIIFIAGSLFQDITYNQIPINKDWEESLSWMVDNTPDPGFGYSTLYSADTYLPPEQSYGIMSWWVSGHFITYIARRAPISNPFQQGAEISASFLTSRDEDQAVDLLKESRGKYVITDTRLISSSYPSLQAWSSEKYPILNILTTDQGISSYINSNYYLGIAPRLHVYDGSYTEPDKVFLVGYRPEEYLRTSGNILGCQVSVNSIPYTIADAKLDEFRELSNSDIQYFIGQSDFSQPVIPIPALRHFRLVHESNTSTKSGLYDSEGNPAREFSTVKTFEFIPGHEISGEGMIEIPLRTNTGREFYYKQQSINNTFILPYPTDTCVGGVCPLGPYIIKDTGETINVSEVDISHS